MLKIRLATLVLFRGKAKKTGPFGGKTHPTWRSGLLTETGGISRGLRTQIKSKLAFGLTGLRAVELDQSRSGHAARRFLCTPLPFPYFLHCAINGVSAINGVTLSVCRAVRSLPPGRDAGPRSSWPIRTDDAGRFRIVRRFCGGWPGLSRLQGRHESFSVSVNNKSGVVTTGTGNPNSVLTTRRCCTLLALARCRQFQVSRKSRP